MSYRLPLTIALTLLLVALGFCTGCQHHSVSAASFFPDSTEAPGWSKDPEIRTFSAEHLSDYIDGDAEKYLKAGVKSAATADYKFKGEIQVVVDVYTMSSTDGAKTIFESEPAVDSQSPSLGDAARLFSQSLVFRKGPYLVRMVAYQESPQIAPAMLALGHVMEKKLSR